MQDEILSLLRCPASGEGLIRLSDDLIGTADGRHLYEVRDGIYHLLPEGRSESGKANGLRPEKEIVRTFYDSYGWQKADGGRYRDTALFVDTRDLSYRVTRHCMRRVGKYLPRRGRFILDAGSGPIPHEEYLEYHKNFERRICLDFSVVALKEAQRKLGERGVYILGDLTNLPIRDDAMDAVVSNHVVYHIPADEQRKAFLELWRVLAPRGRAAIVYAWAYSPLSARLQRLLVRLRPDRREDAADAPPHPDLYYRAHSWEWFKSQNWPFRYRIASYRMISGEIMRRYFSDDLASHLLAFGMLGLQRALPGFAGRYGQYPIIAIEKTPGRRAVHPSAADPEGGGA